MLLKLRNRPERRLKQCRSQVSKSGTVQARRDHDACATRGRCPPLQRGRTAPTEDGRVSRVLRHGRFQFRGSGRPDSVASAAPRRQQLGLRPLRKANRRESGHDR